MDEVSVADAARQLDISTERVRQRIGTGQIHARQVAGHWLVDPASLPSAPRRGRPMSPRIAWALVELGAGRRAPWLTPGDAYRLRVRIGRLADDDNPELLLRSWLAARADRHVLSAPQPDALRDDPRVVVSGLADPRSRMSGTGQAEGYVHPDDFDGVRRDHLLVPSDHGNVILHVSAMVPCSPVPVLLLAADLADHDSSRELGRARELIAQVMKGRRTP